MKNINNSLLSEIDEVGSLVRSRINERQSPGTE